MRNIEGNVDLKFRALLLPTGVQFCHKISADQKMIRPCAHTERKKGQAVRTVQWATPLHSPPSLLPRPGLTGIDQPFHKYELIGKSFLWQQFL